MLHLYINSATFRFFDFGIMREREKNSNYITFTNHFYNGEKYDNFRQYIARITRPKKNQIKFISFLHSAVFSFRGFLPFSFANFLLHPTANPARFDCTCAVWLDCYIFKFYSVLAIRTRSFGTKKNIHENVNITITTKCRAQTGVYYNYVE